MLMAIRDIPPLPFHPEITEPIIGHRDAD